MKRVWQTSFFFIKTFVSIMHKAIRNKNKKYTAGVKKASCFFSSFEGQREIFSCSACVAVSHRVPLACVLTHIFPIRCAMRGPRAGLVIMSLSTLCISAAAQHILEHTDACARTGTARRLRSQRSNVNKFLMLVFVLPCSSDHNCGTFLPQDAQLLQ